MLAGFPKTENTGPEEDTTETFEASFPRLGSQKSPLFTIITGWSAFTDDPVELIGVG